MHRGIVAGAVAALSLVGTAGAQAQAVYVTEPGYVEPGYVVESAPPLYAPAPVVTSPGYMVTEPGYVVTTPRGYAPPRRSYTIGAPTYATYSGPGVCSIDIYGNQYCD